MEIANRVRQFKWPKPARPDRWDEEVLFCESDQYFDDMLSGIGTAQHSIRFETYIFTHGQLADRIAMALIAAARRGVFVHLLVDGVGSPAFWRDYGLKLQSEGVHVRLFRAWPWQFYERHLSIAEAIGDFFYRWNNLNRGNHRKTCLVDEQVAWISSCNVSDVHLTRIMGKNAWVDFGVRVRGSELSRLKHTFDVAFEGDLLQSPFQPLESLITFNSSLVLRRTVQHNQLRRLRRAQKRAWLQTPYFVPTRSIYRRLIRLAKNGLDVRLMVPATSDVPLIRYLSYAFFRRLLRAGVKIFEFGPRFMHQKTSVIDDWFSLGSSNLNHRSVFHDLEVDVTISQIQNQEFMLQKFLSEQAQCVELKIADMVRLRWYERLLGRFLLLLRYWS